MRSLVFRLCCALSPLVLIAACGGGSSDAPRANAVPTAIPDAFTTDEDTSVAITIVATDGDGDELSYMIGTGPSNGTLSGRAPDLDYTPAPDYFGSDSFTFTASDGTDTSAPATVTIRVNPINDAPRGLVQSQATLVDTELALSLQASDLDGDPLVFAVTVDPVNGVLSGTAPDLSYAPAAGFSGGDEFQFVASDGSADAAPVKVSLHVVEHILHVATTGDDAASGTESDPLLTLNRAIELAGASFTTAVVKIAAGRYEIDSNVAGPGDGAIELREGVSVIGGFDPADWSEQNAVVHETILQDRNDDDTGTNAPRSINRLLHADATISGATVVEGLTIRGGGGDYVAAVLLDSGSPRLRSNVISGGENAAVTPAAETSWGVYLVNSAARIESNWIDGGSGGHFSVAIENSGAAPMIVGNTLFGGTNSLSSTQGIRNMRGSRASVINNVIHSGDSTRGFAIAVSLSPGGTIYNNTIYSEGLGISEFSSGSDIRNNIIQARNACIVEENVSDPIEIGNNDLFMCDRLYVDNGTVEVGDLNAAITFGGGSATLAALGNLSLDPEFVSLAGADGDVAIPADNDWHLSAESPHEVRTGGQDLSASFASDRDNNTRTGDGAGAGWSMGAYEY